MTTVVEDGVRVTNIDNSELNRLKRSENALDCGAERVLEALELFIDDLEAKHYYKTSIPYEKMFNALKCVISSSKENQKIRDAIMTGIIEEASGPVEKYEPKVREVRKVVLNVEDVSKYVKEHTIAESSEYFGCTKSEMKAFVQYHNIDYKRSQKGPTSTVNESAVRKAAEMMTLTELANFFRCTKQAMYIFCKRRGIEYRRKRNNV